MLQNFICIKIALRVAAIISSQSYIVAVFARGVLIVRHDSFGAIVKAVLKLNTTLVASTSAYVIAPYNFYNSSIASVDDSCNDDSETARWTENALT